METKPTTQRHAHNVTLLDLTVSTAKGCGRSQVDCNKVIREFFAAVVRNVAAGRAAELRGHFTIYPRTRKPRPARNPRTGEVVPLPERRVMLGRFAPGWIRA